MWKYSALGRICNKLVWQSNHDDDASRMKLFACTDNDQTLLYHYYIKIVRNMNLRSWLEQKSGKGVGGNGGKFLERENANWKGEHIWGWNGPPCIGPHWHCINLGNVFGRHQVATRTAYFTLSHCHPSGHFPPFPFPFPHSFMRSKKVSHTGGWLTSDHSSWS